MDISNGKSFPRKKKMKNLRRSQINKNHLSLKNEKISEELNNKTELKNWKKIKRTITKIHCNFHLKKHFVTTELVEKQTMALISLLFLF